MNPVEKERDLYRIFPRVFKNTVSIPIVIKKPNGCESCIFYREDECITVDCSVYSSNLRKIFFIYYKKLVRRS